MNATGSWLGRLGRLGRTAPVPALIVAAAAAGGAWAAWLLFAGAWVWAAGVAAVAVAVPAWVWARWRARTVQSLVDQIGGLSLPAAAPGARLPRLAAPASAPELAPLAAAVEQAWLRQQADIEAQKRLVADASHQLRTPLAVLRTQLQATPTQDAWLLGLLRTVDRATAVADEWLMRLKIEQHARDVAASMASSTAATAAHALRLDDVAREAALEFSPLIAERRLEFELDAVDQQVAADPWMVGELVRNLLANAIRHTPDAGSLGIVVRAADQGPEIVVWDSGTGIADGERARLFEPFSAATGGTGVGLGLSICRQLAAAMSAEVALFNRTDGERVVGVDAVVRWGMAAVPARVPSSLAEPVHPQETP